MEKIEKDCGYLTYGIEKEIDNETGEQIENSDYVLISLVYIYPKYRRQGNAKRLLAEAIEEIKKLNLTIKLAALPKENSISQTDLVAFYESMGFVAWDEDQGGAAVIMTLK